MISGNTAADRRHKESKVRMSHRIMNEIYNLGINVHNCIADSRNRVALSLRALWVAIDGTEISARKSSRTAVMESSDIASLCKCLHKEAYVKTEIM